MKIGIDIRNIGKRRTGDEVVFFNLVKKLAQTDSVNEYKLFTDITDKKILDEIKNSLKIEDKSGFQIVSLKTLNKFSWNFWTIQSHLRKYPVNIYLTQYITPFFVPKKIKIITIIHDISFNFYPQFIKKGDLFFLKTLIPMSLRRANKIIGVSKFTHDEIIKFYKINPEKADWIHNAVSENFLKQNVSDEKIEKVRKKYSLPKNFILYLGTLQPRKNILTLVEAYNFARIELGEMKLVIAGGKGHNFDKNIRKYISRYDLEKDVIMPGFIDEEDKAALIKSACIFCFPSFYEGFGIPVLEAMAMEIPAIISDISPHKEIAEKAALYFNPNISGELAQKIINLIKNPVLRESLITEGLRQVGKFSWKNTAEKMVRIFESME